MDEWIRVAESLPDHDLVALVWAPGMPPLTERFDAQKKCFTHQRGYSRVPYEEAWGVKETHWMPLPAPPNSGTAPEHTEGGQSDE